MHRLVCTFVALVATIVASATLALAQPAPPQQCVSTALAGGTGDAITIPLLPCSVTTTLLILTFTAANGTTTPTIAMVGATAPQTLVRQDGSALLIGQLSSGLTGIITNNGTNWVWLTAAVGGAGGALVIGSTPVTGGVNTDVLNVQSGVLNQYSVTGSAGSVVLSNAPTVANLTVTGSLTLSSLPAGTQVACLGLTSSNAVVPQVGTCGSGTGFMTISGSNATGAAFANIVNAANGNASGTVQLQLARFTATGDANHYGLYLTNNVAVESTYSGIDQALLYLNAFGTEILGFGPAGGAGSVPVQVYGNLTVNKQAFFTTTFGQIGNGGTPVAATTYTFVLNDCGTEVVFTSNSAVTATIPVSIVNANPLTCNIAVLQAGTAKVSVNGSAVTPAVLVSAHSFTGTSGTAGSVIGLDLVTVGATATAYLLGDGS